ncbi:MAG: FAD-binding oxidoreductase [Candidatus Helarchaeota archaeon]
MEKCGEWKIINESIINKLKEIVGKDRVIRTTSILIQNGNPDIIVKTTEKSQIIKIIKLALENNIPIVPKSSEIDYYDGAKPENGGILLDMSKMKNILNIREGSDRCVTIEPGVTFEELQTFLNEKGFKCMVPLGLPSQASVLSSYLERIPLLSGPIVILSEGSQCIMDLEVIRGDGSILHTGSAATVPTRAGISPNGPIGPDWTRIFTAAQGTMGIVTEMSLKFKHVPDFQKILLKPYEDLEKILTDIMSIKRIDIGKECLGISNLNMAAILSETKKEFIHLRKKIPEWTLVLNVTGWDQEEIDILEEDLNDLNIKFSNGAYKRITDKPNIEELLLEEFNLPNKLIAHRGYKGNCQIIPFYAKKSTILEFDEEIQDIAKTFGYEIKDLYGYLMPIEQARIFYFEYTLYSEPTDVKNSNSVNFLFEEISEFIIRKGGIIDRPYGIWRKMIYSKMPNYLKILKEAKRILDPKNIFNPGKIFMEEIGS